MAHPFFDTLEYPIGRPDADKLLIKLCELYSEVASVAKIFRKSKGASGTFPTNKPDLQTTWLAVLDLLAGQGLLKKFCVIVQQDSLNNLLVQEAIQAVLNAKYSIDSGPTLADPDQPIVLDRKDLRESLGKLISKSSTAKVILVRGERVSGKSHSGLLFEQLARESGTEANVFSRDMGLASVEELINWLFRNFDKSLVKIPPPTTTPDAWYKEVLGELKGLAATSKKTLWIMMDDLGHDEENVTLLDDNIRQFFKQFVLNMSNADFRQWFRLMLIDYPDNDDIPARWKSIFYREEKMQSADIQATHIADYLTAWALATGKRMPAETAQKRANEVIQAVDTYQPAPNERPRSRLTLIHDTLLETLKTKPV